MCTSPLSLPDKTKRMVKKLAFDIFLKSTLYLLSAKCERLRVYSQLIGSVNMPLWMVEQNYSLNVFVIKLFEKNASLNF